MNKPNIEIECKLIARDASALAGIPKALREICSAVQSLGCEAIRDVYLDTPDRRLFEAGYACRIRRACRPARRPRKGGAGRRGGERAVLALKALAAPSRMVSVREEFEQALPGEAPPQAEDLAGTLLKGGAVGKKIRGILQGRELSVLFSIRNRRKNYAVRFGEKGLLAQVSLDDFTVQAGDKKRRLAEVEIELKSGSAAELRRLGRLLASRAALGTRSRAKFRQGLELARLAGRPYGSRITRKRRIT